MNAVDMLLGGHRNGVQGDVLLAANDTLCMQFPNTVFRKADFQ